MGKCIECGREAQLTINNKCAECFAPTRNTIEEIEAAEAQRIERLGHVPPKFEGVPFKRGTIKIDPFPFFDDSEFRRQIVEEIEAAFNEYFAVSCGVRIVTIKRNEVFDILAKAKGGELPKCEKS